MPGCLGMDALWQLLGFTLGWLGGTGSGRALSVGEVKFMGQVLPTAKLLKFHLDLKRIISRKLYLGIADGWVECDVEQVFADRSEERRGGKGGVSHGQTRVAP